MSEIPGDVVAARLKISPPPLPSEMAAIIAALHGHRARMASTAAQEPEVEPRSGWEITARREAVYGVWTIISTRQDRATNWER
ncbi:MAG TPA: hypothetical protein VKU87_11280 [Thermomicrobiaceae bacterium]|nr:hypothetical protein [Thermomicrobiaceae bacterium]